MLVSDFISIDRQECLSLLDKREVDLLIQNQDNEKIFYDKKAYGNDLNGNLRFYYDIHTIYRDRELIKYLTTSKKIVVVIK